MGNTFGCCPITARFSLFSHIARMPVETEAKEILIAPPRELEEITRTPSCYMDADLNSNNLSLNEATNVAQNCLLWRLASTFRVSHSYPMCCMLENKKICNSCDDAVVCIFECLPAYRPKFSLASQATCISLSALVSAWKAAGKAATLASPIACGPTKGFKVLFCAIDSSSCLK